MSRVYFFSCNILESAIDQLQLHAVLGRLDLGRRHRLLLTHRRDNGRAGGGGRADRYRY